MTRPSPVVRVKKTYEGKEVVLTEVKYVWFWNGIPERVLGRDAEGNGYKFCQDEEPFTIEGSLMGITEEAWKEGNNVMGYYDDILKALKELDVTVKHSAKTNKVNEPYVNTKPTQEDVEQIREAVINKEPDSDKQALFMVERLWNEVERLRSILKKQIY